MTRSELVEQVANRTSLSKQEAADAVDAVVRTIEETLAAGGEVTIAGFGKFHVAQRGARQGINPRTRAPIEIAASRVPRFSAGSALKTAVRGG